MHFARNAPRYADLSSIQCIPTHKILNPPCKKPHTASRHVVKARPHLRATARTLRAAVQRGPKSRPNRDFIARPGGQPASCAPSISPRLARVRRARSTGHGVGTSPRRSLDGRTTTLDGLACTASDRDRTLDSSRRRAPAAAEPALLAHTGHAAPVACSGRLSVQVEKPVMRDFMRIPPPGCSRLLPRLDHGPDTCATPYEDSQSPVATFASPLGELCVSFLADVLSSEALPQADGSDP